MEATFRTGNNLAQSLCKFTGFMVTGTREVIAFQLSRKGCTGDLQAFINKEMINGRDTDLSGLAISETGDTHITLVVRDLMLTLTLNGKEVFNHAMQEDIGEIGGIQWYFEDPGQISQLQVSDDQHQWDLIADPFAARLLSETLASKQPPGR